MYLNRALLLFSLVSWFINYEVQAKENNNDTEQGLTMVSGSNPVATAGFIIQQVSHPYYHAGGIYYYKRKEELIFVDKKMNGFEYAWYQKNGKIVKTVIKEISGEIPSIVIPDNKDVNKYIIGSDLNLRIAKKNATSYEISKPVIQFNETGYIIAEAHCDKNGRMFILLSCIIKTNPSKLYKIENKKATLVGEYPEQVNGFRFNQEETLLYMICDHGKKIHEFKYNLASGVIGKHEVAFNIHNENLANYTMKAITMDRDGNLWAAASGKEGLILNINSKNGTVIHKIALPVKDIISLTFGYNEYKSLFVGSTKACAKGIAQGAIYVLSGMGKQGVPDRPIAW